MHHMAGGQHASPVKPGPPHWAYFTFAQDGVGEGVVTGTGAEVGAAVGASVGAGVGSLVGNGAGAAVGAAVGASVGAKVGMTGAKSSMPPSPAQLASHVSAHGSH
mmetsp:Transcript_49796/g.113837  ORF Transcript_49796/g.113837 Transcript_49796/m.113837 type:complete len:105 (+) Transcript_49796:219-533(+)